MKSLLKFLVMAAVLIFAGLWVMTLAKSCNNSGSSALNNATDKAGNLIADGADAVKGGAGAIKDGVDDLISDDEDDDFDAEFDEDGDEILDDEDDDEDMDDDEADFDDEEDDTDENVRKNTGSSTSSSRLSSESASSGVGNYLVVSGSFLTEANAKKEVRRLKNLGYNNAEVVEFDFSQYHSVCVKRTNSLSEARGVKNQLINKHGVDDAYVHKKRKSKRNRG